jgi:hypothetical protein
MLNPSKPGWIKKYLHLVRRHEISLSDSYNSGVWTKERAQTKLAESGIIFGVFAEFIFLKNQGEDKWTNHEKLIMLYFESMLLVYLSNNLEGFNEEDFLNTLERFLSLTGSEEIEQIWSINRWLKVPNNIEKTIAERTRIPLNFNDKIWVSYLQNSLCYLDIILFDDYVQNADTTDFVALRKRKVKLTLCTIILAFQADSYLDESERQMFRLFLASADLNADDRAEFVQLLKEGVPVSSIKEARTMNILFRKYLLELAIFSMLSDTEFTSRERKVLNRITNILNLTTREINEAYDIVETFVIKNEAIVTNLKSSSSYERIYIRLSSKWSKILLRNKDKLIRELKDSSELVALIKKSMKEPLNDAEKAKVKSQFIDIARTIPSLAIFLLPGGAFLLPFILKIVPDLIPSAFRDNEVE